MAVDIAESRELKERVVEINRVAKVVKGGRRFSFTALVVIGDEVDRVGVGYGKAREVPLAISKAVDDAKKNLFTVPKHGQTITHEVLGRFGAARVLLRPASPGTGVIAGGGVRAVLELGGIRDVLAKSLGTTNPINMLKAAESALRDLRRPEEVALARGKAIRDVLPLPARVKEPRAPRRRSGRAGDRRGGVQAGRWRRGGVGDSASPHPDGQCDRAVAAAPRHAPRARPRPDRQVPRARRDTRSRRHASEGAPPVKVEEI